MRTFPLPSVLALALAACLDSPRLCHAAPSDVESPAAWAQITVERDSPTRLQLTSNVAQAELASALERITGRPAQRTDYAPGWVMWSSELPAIARNGLTLHQRIPLEPLLDVLGAAGQPNLTLMVHLPRAGFATLSGASVLAVQPGTLHASLPTAAPHLPLELELGWRGSDVARIAWLMLLAFLAPIIAGVAVWWRSIRHDRTPEKWFARGCSIQAIVILGWTLWLVAVEATRVVDLMGFVVEGRARTWLAGPTFWLLGFLPVALILAAILNRVLRRLRGLEAPPPAFGALLASARGGVALLLLVVSITAFGAGDIRSGVFTLLAALAASVLLPGAAGPLGTSPQALSTGALRDRLFDLAGRAGVKLRGLFVVPLRRERMANAFAVHGGVVMVADELLDRLSRREVDSVLAHEISHLEHHHPITILLAGAAASTSVCVATIPFGLPFPLPAGILAFTLTYTFVSRRCEFGADAGAVALTGDPEAMISGLGRIARFNDTPLAWGRSLGWLVTHPTTEARGRAIGRRAGLAPERVSELLTNGLSLDQRYGHEARPGETDRVFSTAWKRVVLSRASLALLATAACVPAAALAFAGVLGLEWPRALVLLGCAALSLVAVLLVHDSLGARIVSQLERPLRRRLAGSSDQATEPLNPSEGHAGEQSTAGDLFVALSPGDRARVYEGFLDWDLGLLTIGPDRLSYRGEQIGFDLPRAALRAVEVGAEAPGWIRVPRVIVRWRGPAGEEAITLRDGKPTRISAIGRSTHVLAARLRAWHDGEADQGSDSARTTPHRGEVIATEAREATLTLGPVTAMTPAEAAAPRDLPLLVALIATLSAAAAFLFALDFWSGLTVFTAALMSMLALRWPAMTSRERAPSGPVEPGQVRRAA